MAGSPGHGRGARARPRRRRADPRGTLPAGPAVGGRARLVRGAGAAVPGVLDGRPDGHRLPGLADRGKSLGRAGPGTGTGAGARRSPPRAVQRSTRHLPDGRHVSGSGCSCRRISPHTPWTEALGWVRAHTPADTHLLLDPQHIWTAGASGRVVAVRDILLEDDTDAAMAFYSRDLAMRIAERRAAVGRFEALDEERTLALARRYGLIYLVSAAALALPVAFQSGEVRVYVLQPPGSSVAAAPPASAIAALRRAEQVLPAR